MQGMAIGIKNALALLPAAHTWFDFAVNESCENFGECGLYKPMLDSNKAVFGVEYSTR